MARETEESPGGVGTNGEAASRNGEGKHSTVEANGPHAGASPYVPRA